MTDRFYDVQVTFNRAEKIKLLAIAKGATLNDTDANLRDRTTHTGAQAISTVTGLQTDLDAKALKATTINGYSLATNVLLAKADVGLGNVDNTNDVNKPVSTATQTALNLKVDKTTTVNGYALSSNIALVKADVGLGNVDNTSDVNKPVSTATQAALNAKQDLNANLVDKTVVNDYTAQQNFTSLALTSTTNSIAWNLSTAQMAHHVATENTTLANPTNMKSGGRYTFRFVQHATIARTLAFGTGYKWPAGVAPVASIGANAVDIINFVSDGTFMYGTFNQNFS